jgi:pyruvate/2-oxoglutarate dehydrogenase complex dihydrolipoamide dehydrogenase (E3) component
MAAAAPVSRFEPEDQYNRTLADNVHPSDWVNPAAKRRYNLVVVGGGTAGLVAAAGAAGLGATVALVEKGLLGGDCLNFGCVPSKALIRTARAAAEMRAAATYGIQPVDVRVDFGRVMERMRRLRAELSAKDSARRYRDELGVDVFIGEARFTSANTVEVDGQTLRFHRACIATGARAAVPPIPGLAEAAYLTNETVFSLTELPRRIAVLGAGPIGCEISQTFQRFGAEVTLLARGPHILPREDEDAACLVEQSMRRDGMRLLTDVSVGHVQRRGREKVLTLKEGGTRRELAVDEILVGVGRVPNVAGLGLEAAGVEYDELHGVTVDDRMRTSNRRIFAAGDVASRFKFTHMSDATARIVIRNALFCGRDRISALTVPWCTYTDPEIGHVGLSEREAYRRGIAVRTLVQDLRDVDRAVVDSETSGLVKVHVRKGKDQIIGATVVANHAGEMLSELTLAIARGVGLGAVATVIHPYPTQAEAIKKVADASNRARLTPRVKRLFSIWFSLAG